MVVGVTVFKHIGLSSQFEQTFKATLPVTFIPFIPNMGQILQEWICFTSLEAFCCQWKQTGSHISCFPLKNGKQKHGSLPMLLKASFSESQVSSVLTFIIVKS